MNTGFFKQTFAGAFLTLALVIGLGFGAGFSPFHSFGFQRPFFNGFHPFDARQFVHPFGFNHFGFNGFH